MKDLLRSESRFWALVEDTWKRKGAHGGTLFLGTCRNFTRWDHLGIIDSCPFPKGSATATTATKQRLPFSLQRPPPALSPSSLFYCSYSLIIVRDIQGSPAGLSIESLLQHLGLKFLVSFHDQKAAYGPAFPSIFRTQYHYAPSIKSILNMLLSVHSSCVPCCTGIRCVEHVSSPDKVICAYILRLLHSRILPHRRASSKT